MTAVHLGLLLQQSHTKDDLGPLRLGLRGRRVRRFAPADAPGWLDRLFYPVVYVGYPYKPRRAA